MNNRIDAIYARQSVDKKDSISIESQIEFCKYELKGGNCKEYKDKGYSGKNTERPQFQQLMRDIESGLVRKVVVYKLDRISRSILDFAKMMDFFQKYANSKIEELDARRQSIANEIAKLSADAVPMEKMESISGYLDDWENVSFEDKRQVVDALITVIRATNEKVEIEWKI